MRRSRAALVVGLLVVLLAFAYGTEHDATITVAGQRVHCGSAIPADWLVSGTPSGTAPPCHTVVQRARTGVFAAMGAGALLALIGWTALREPSAPRRAGRPEVRSA